MKLELTAEQLMVIHEGLMMVAFGKAAPVVDAINRQLNPMGGMHPSGRPNGTALPVGTAAQMQALDAQHPVGEKPDLTTLSDDY